jgi:hypothetical protein
MAGTPPGVYAVKAEVRYQACDDKRCLAPETLPLAARIEVE